MKVITVLGERPSFDLESAILITLDPGTYTAILSGNNGTTGAGLVEIGIPALRGRPHSKPKKNLTDQTHQKNPPL